MAIEIPYSAWEPLSIKEVTALFANAPFMWGLAGGYAIEQFLGSSIRPHEDIDITVFRDEQQKLQEWLNGWRLFAADPPGTLRPWEVDEFLSPGIHDIWGYRVGTTAWQLQIMLAESQGDHWVSRRHPMIRGKRDEFIVEYHGIPCLRIEIQLMYKAKSRRHKDDLDFHVCLPQMSSQAKHWLKEQLLLLYPQGHTWAEYLG